MSMRQWLLANGAFAAAFLLTAPAAVEAQARVVQVNIPEKPLAMALSDYARQTRQPLLFTPALVKDKRSRTVAGRYTPQAALQQLLEGTGIRYTMTSGGALLLSLAERSAEVTARVPLPTPVTMMRGRDETQLAMQDAGSSVVPTGSAGAEVIDDIVVTAQRRNEALQTVPIALTALGRDELIRQGITSSTGLSGIVPNVQIGSRGPATQIAIRGVGNTNDNPGGDPTVGFYIDGVYHGRTAAAGASFFDIERIEVLRGPQGTLYGRNATAGAINVITAKPKDRFEASFDVAAGNYDLIRTEGMVNVPVATGISLRAAFSTEDHDGYLKIRNPSAGVTRNADDEKRRSLRLHALFQPVDDLTILVTGDYFKRGGVGGGNVSPPIVNKPDPWLNPLDNQNRLDNRDWGISTEVNWALGAVDLTYVGAHRESDRFSRIDVDNGTNPAASTVAEVQADSKQDSHELRLASTARPLQWLVGLYYYRETATDFNQNFVASLPAGTTIINDAPEIKAVSKAVFGQATYAFGEQFDLTAGLRYTKDDKSRIANQIRRNTLTGVNTLVLASRGDFHSDSVDWKLLARWTPREGFMLYASAASGYKAGGYYDGLPPNDYQPEELLSYEAGFKSRFLDNRLQLNAAAFYYDYSGFQVIQGEVLPNFQGTGAVIRNAQKASVKGAEVESELLIGRGGQLNLSGSLLDAQFDRFIIPAALGNAFGVPAGSPINYSGLRINKAPRWTFTAAYQHRWQIGSAGELVARVQHFASASYFLEFDNLLRSRQRAFARTDAYVTFNAPGKAWYVQGFINNIQNRAVLVTGGVRASIAPPRTYGARAGIRF